MIWTALVAFALAATGLAATWSALGAARVLRRLKRTPTRAIANLEPGAAEVVGRLVTSDPPLSTVSGAPALALRTRVGYTYQVGAKGKVLLDPFALDRTEAVRLEVEDATGRCDLEMEQALLVGPEGAWKLGALEVSQQHPALWEALQRKVARDHVVLSVQVHQQWLPVGTEGFVSGEAVPGESARPGDDYRSARRALKLRGTTERALIVSAFPEAHVRRIARRPLLVLAWCAALCFAAAAGLVAAQWLVSRSAGV